MQHESSDQLDILLKKAASYSHFILENQKRSTQLLPVQQSQYKKGSSKDDQIDTSNSHNSSSKKISAPSSTRKSKKRALVDADDNKEMVDTNKNQPGSADKENRKSKFQQPANLIGGQLMPYQLEGLQWLLSLWENGLNGILADEMGLGKTIQIISLIAHLRQNNTSGPYLIAGPLATITNWVKEFKKWLPSCPVLLYHGDKKEREELRQKHMSVANAKSLSFPVVVTSFDMCIVDRAHLEKFLWQYIILDEGHRIKNRNCKLIRELKSIRSVSRLLLTGTPIQNSLEELWSLLNFCSPMIFDDLEVFKSWFDFKNIGQETSVEDILSTEETNRIVTKMHEILRPFVLRRLKTETLGDKIPPKREIVVYCGMSSLQREYYAEVLAGDLRDNLIAAGVENAKKISQINMTMNLRKVCNHPFLFGDLIDQNTGESLRYSSGGKFLVLSSGKMKLLDRMLMKLYSQKHKVLIFSQMTSLMDILEDYLIAKQFSFVRFDGSTKLIERQRCIDQFNAKESDVFVFLLSTRAGGLGINLTAADTVILYDSDWNPHQDSQAQDRCHRIGQVEKVVIYRFLTSGSVEIDMMKKQLSKKKLERLTMQGGDYRKAGRREGRQQISLNDLRSLLEDDVKNLSRMETKAKSEQLMIHDNGDNDGGNDDAVKKTGISNAWIQRDISDIELDMIMDRDRLFPSTLKSSSRNSSSGRSDALADTISATDDNADAPVGVIDVNFTDLKDIDRIEAMAVAVKLSIVDHDASGGGATSNLMDGGEYSGIIPVEGEMYDIITESSLLNQPLSSIM